MSEETGSRTRGAQRRSETREELRTIAFRLRELQRLMAMRVEQENRRLESDGIKPVEGAALFRRTPPNE